MGRGGVNMGTLILGLLTGILFGFVLQKGQALRYDRQVGLLRFQDFTILKIMLTAILVGMAGVYFFLDLGLARLNIKPTTVAANILGGLIFGLGWGLLGYCPGTALGATGEGRWDAFWGGVLGMLVGASLFAKVYPSIQKNLLQWGDFGKLTIPQVLGIHHWVVILILWGIAFLFLRWIEKSERSGTAWFLK